MAIPALPKGATTTPPLPSGAFSFENLDNKTKYILGANYFIRGDIGNYDNTTLVKNV